MSRKASPTHSPLSGTASALSGRASSLSGPEKQRIPPCLRQCLEEHKECGRFRGFYGAELVVYYTEDSADSIAKNSWCISGRFCGFYGGRFREFRTHSTVYYVFRSSSGGRNVLVVSSFDAERGLWYQIFVSTILFSEMSPRGIRVRFEDTCCVSFVNGQTSVSVACLQ